MTSIFSSVGNIYQNTSLMSFSKPEMTLVRTAQFSKTKTVRRATTSAVLVSASVANDTGAQSLPPSLPRPRAVG